MFVLMLLHQRSCVTEQQWTSCWQGLGSSPTTDRTRIAFTELSVWVLNILILKLNPQKGAVGHSLDFGRLPVSVIKDVFSLSVTVDLSHQATA